MSSESFGHNDAPPSQAPRGDATDASVPGYPPVGQQERLAAIRAQEAAEQPENVDTQLEGALASLDAPRETPTQRSTRLGLFLEDYFSETVPSDLQAPAIERCVIFENQCRELFGEPDLELGDEDASDPELKAEIENAVSIAEKDETISARESEQADLSNTEAEQRPEIQRTTQQRAELEALHPEIPVPATEAERQELQDAQRVQLQASMDEKQNELTRNAEVNRDLESVKELQANFEQLKAEHGTIGALKMLLAEEGVKSPEMRAIVQRAVNTAEALVGAIPGKGEEIERLLDQSGLNLGATSQAEVFASLFTAAEASDEFTAEEVEALRRVVNDHEDIDTGSDIKDALAEGRETITHADGTIEMVGYDEENPLVANNLSVYPDGDLIRGTANFGGLQVPFKAPLNTPSSTLNERLNVSLYTVINEAAGVTGGTNQGFEVTQGVAEIDLSDEFFEGQATREAKLGIENMTDSFDIGTRLIDRQTINQLAWGHQWLMRGKDVIGDAGYGDNDERARAETLGGRGHEGLIWSADDRLNEENFITACRYIRERARSGMAEPDVGALIAHVERINGQQPRTEDL